MESGNNVLGSNLDNFFIKIKVDEMGKVFFVTMYDSYLMLYRIYRKRIFIYLFSLRHFEKKINF